MGKFHFWATLIMSAVFGLWGFFLGKSIVLPTSSINTSQTQVIFAVLGVLSGLLVFSRLFTWLVQSVALLGARAISRLATEIINQIVKAASRGLPFLPFPTPGERLDDRRNGQNFGGSLIVDTSSIIDGRILEVAKTGFLSGMLLVPNFVLLELQQVADSADSIKRARGRRGFEIISDLKKISGLKLEIWDKEISGKNVDEKLIRLGKILRGRILTCDFNLNKVAKLQGVNVLNLNDLGNALKTLPVPGEKLAVKVEHKGKDTTQGVGYLQDGTMVVIKEASGFVGSEVTAEVTKILQGPAGRMIFGKIAE